MVARAARRLPGVQLESRPPLPAEVLPRMDVAAFVGFAASGPLHTPVPVDDPRAFADLFGEDAPLAWDRERGELARGKLGPAVRAFFRNGGTRCWAVRVARAEPSPAAPHDWARANRFPIPGLARVRGSSLAPAYAAARSEGSWSDRLGVGAAIQLRPLLVSAPAVDERGVVSVRLDAPDAVVVGDVLRLTFLAGSPPSPVASLVAPVAAHDGRLATLGAGAAWLLAAPPSASPSPWRAACFPRGEEPEPLPALDGDPAFRADGTASLVLAAEAPVVPGAFVLLTRGAEQVWVLVDGARTTDRPTSPPARGTALDGRWSRVAFAPPAGLLADPAAALVGERARVELWVTDGGGHPLRLGDLGLAPGHPRFLGALPADRRLYARDEDLLPADEQALRAAVRAVAGDGVDLASHHATLFRAVANPRFPLASDSGGADAFVPLGMPVVPEWYLGAAAVPGDAAERDGLATFDADLFLDPALADETASGLAAQADFMRWQQPSPRRLRGVHALLDVDEATLVAIPDAAQRGWSREQTTAPRDLAAPLLAAAADAGGRWHLTWNRVDPAALHVLERATTEAFADAAPVALSSPADVAYDVPPGPTAPPASPGATWFRVRAFITGPAPGWFEVGEREVAGSFWSDPVEVVVPPPTFLGCPPGALGAPLAALVSAPDVNGTFRLGWSAVPGALAYEVQESSALDFAEATTVFLGDASEVALYGRAPGRSHYRVRARGSEAQASAPVALAGGGYRLDVTVVGTPAHVVAARYAGAIGEEVVFDGAAFTERFSAAGSARAAAAGGFRYDVLRDGGWPGAPTFRAFDPAAVGRFGNGVAVTVPSPARRVLNPVAAYPGGASATLLAVQRGLLRLCAARGDLLAVLSLPEHYREDDAARHGAALRALTPEEAPWSHGALYHPWLVSEGGDGGLLRAPPDGAVCGLMARRAAQRGAWIAPANEPLGDVVGLTPPIAREAWERLLDAQVNLVRQEPHGFVVLGADTLAQDPDLLAVNVRRLLSLLRRVALRLGPAFVFEPNGDVLRRAIEREFATLLDRLHRGGALAGATADEAYQVIVDGALDGAAADQGRFAVELRVAPSLPLTFLTLRLVQSGGRAQVTEER